MRFSGLPGPQGRYARNMTKVYSFRVAKNERVNKLHSPPLPSRPPLPPSPPPRDTPATERPLQAETVQQVVQLTSTFPTVTLETARQQSSLTNSISYCLVTAPFPLACSLHLLSVPYQSSAQTLQEPPETAKCDGGPSCALNYAGIRTIRSESASDTNKYCKWFLEGDRPFLFLRQCRFVL